MAQPDSIPPTSETTSISTPPQAPPTTEPTEPSQPPQSKPSSSKKKSRKPRRPTRRGRRDEIEDDEEGEGGGDGADEGSELSESESERSSSGSEDEEEESPKDEIKKSGTGTATAATGAAKSTAWADITDALDENDETTPVVGMDEFNRNGLDAATATKGEGSTKKPQNRPEQTEEQKRAKALAKKEKLKAKRLAAKLAKKLGGKEKEGTEGQVASSSKTDAREEKEEGSVEQDVVTETPPSTSTTAPPPQPRVSNRQAYLAKISSDPSFVPRVGRFWTHDERHYAAGKFGQGDSEYSGLREMSDYWRGRGFRGRARGFAIRGMAFRGRGGALGPPGGVGHVVPVPPVPAASTSTTVQPATEGTAEEPSQTSQLPNAPTASTDDSVKVTMPTFGKGRWGTGTNQDAERDWNHDGYLQLAKEDDRRAAQRARGRGRGFIQQPRGAFPARGGRGGRFVPPPVATGAIESGRDLVDGTPSTPVVVKLPQSATSAEVLSQAQAAETSTEIPEAPVDEPAVLETASPAPPAEPTSDSTHSSAPPAITADISSLQLQAEYAALRQQQELMRQKEIRLQDEMRRLEIEQQRLRGGLGSAAMYAGSENGSIGSGSASAMAPPPPSLPNSGTMLPPGVAMTENGSFYEITTGQPVVFVPTPSPGPSGSVNGYEQGYRAPPAPQRAPYYPQQNAAPYYQPPMTPDYSSPRGVPQQQQHRQSSSSGSYYPPGASSMPQMGGRESPYQAAPGPGYFALPRQNSRIQIRAPNASGSPTEDMASSVLKKHDRKSSLSNSYRPDQGMQANGMAYPGGAEYGYAGQQQQDPSRYYQQAPQYPAQPQQYPAGTYGEYGYNAQYGAY